MPKENPVSVWSSAFQWRLRSLTHLCGKPSYEAILKQEFLLNWFDFSVTQCCECRTWSQDAKVIGWWLPSWQSSPWLMDKADLWTFSLQQTLWYRNVFHWQSSQSFKMIEIIDEWSFVNFYKIDATKSATILYCLIHHFWDWLIVYDIVFFIWVGTCWDVNLW